MSNEGLWAPQGSGGCGGRTDSAWVLRDRFEPALARVLPCIQPRIPSHLLPCIPVPSPCPNLCFSLFPAVHPVLCFAPLSIAPHSAPSPALSLGPCPAVCPALSPAPRPSCTLPPICGHKGSRSLPDRVPWAPAAPGRSPLPRPSPRAPGGCWRGPPAPTQLRGRAGRLLNKLIRSGRGAGAERGPTVGLLEL